MQLDALSPAVLRELFVIIHSRKSLLVYVFSCVTNWSQGVVSPLEIHLCASYLQPWKIHSLMRHNNEAAASGCLFWPEWKVEKEEKGLLGSAEKLPKAYL